MARKRSAARRASAKRLPQAHPPPDDPLQRHEELNVDRQIVAGGAPTGPPAAAGALATPIRGRRSSGRGAAADGGEIVQTAGLRLDALAQARDTPRRDAGPARP